MTVNGWIDRIVKCGFGGVTVFHPTEYSWVAVLVDHGGFVLPDLATDGTHGDPETAIYAASVMAEAIMMVKSGKPDIMKLFG